MTTTPEQLEAFRAQLEEVNAEYFRTNMPTLPDYFGGVTFTVGKKNARFSMTSGGQGQVLLFVDMATGNILKAAGYNVPAKGARGNIATTKPQAGTGWLYR